MNKYSKACLIYFEDKISLYLNYTFSKTDLNIFILGSCEAIGVQHITDSWEDRQAGSCV